MLALVAVGLLPNLRGPFGGDESYVLANVHAEALRDRWFAFNAHFPGRSGGAWYRGHVPYQRRYVRLAPSGLLQLEAAVFGSCAPCYKRVTLVLHLASCLLGFHLLHLLLGDPRRAALLTAPIGLHPVVGQPIDWVACQPIVLAGLFTLLAGTAWLHGSLRRAPVAPVGWAVPLCAFAAMTSYEAAVGVPLLLLAVDVWWRRAHGLTPAMRWALIGCYPVYAAIVWANTLDATLTDASYRAPIAEFLSVLVADLSGYAVRTLVGWPARYAPEAAPWLAQPALALAVLAALVLAALRWGHRATVVLGMIVYAVLLAPPLLSRAAVSYTNLPSNRQLYLPLLGVAIAAAGAWRGPLRAYHAVVSLSLCGLFAAYHWSGDLHSARYRAHVRMGEVVREALAGRPDSTPVVVIGASRCGYDPRFDAGRHPVYNLVPPTLSGAVPRVEALGRRELRVTSPEGLAVVTSDRSAARGGRIPWAVPSLARTGLQTLDIGTVSASVPRPGDVLHELRYVFDAPLGSQVFLALQGCELPRVLSLP